MGTQQDVLQAQLQKTKLLREIAMHHLQVGKLEAQLKQLLNRSQESPDIEPADLTETPLVQTYAVFWPRRNYRIQKSPAQRK